MLENLKACLKEELKQLVLAKRRLNFFDYKKIQTYNEVLQTLK